MAQRKIAVAKALAHAACAAPLAWLLLRGFGVGGTTLGANPVETVLHNLGTTGLNVLFVTLAVTPARQLTGINWLVRLRRLLGLWCFFYVVMHFASYALLDLRLAWGEIFADIVERPYITVGMAALIGLIPLAITSTKGMQRRLGRRWSTLHRAIYGIAVLALVHFFWQTKADLFEPLIYAGVLTALLGYRVVHATRQRSRRRTRARETAAATSVGGGQ
jgi:sulfoxide reductase heme-binding subunit YedZ